MDESWSSERIEALTRKSGALPPGTPRAVIESLIGHGRFQSFTKGERVSTRMDKERSLFLALSGTIRISADTSQGRTFVVGFVEPGNIWGLRACLDPRSNYRDAIAETDGVLLAVSGKNLRAAMREAPDVQEAVIQIMCWRLGALTAALEQSATWSPKSRLAARLAYLLKTHGRETASGTEIHIPLSQESIAAMIGTSRQTANKLLKEFERSGLICNDYNRISVRNLPGLKKLIELE